LLVLFLIKKKLPFADTGVDKAFCNKLLKDGFIFGLIIFLVIINFNLNTLVIGFFRPDFEIGGYSAVYKILVLLISVISFMNILIFPILAKNEGASESLIRINKKIYRAILPAGIAICFAVLILRNPLISILYGAQYAQFSYLLFILIWVFLLTLLREPAVYTLFAIGRQKTILKIFLISACLNVILNIYFVPHYGLAAAAISTLSAEFINFVFINAAMIKYLKYNCQAIIS
jgi:O-antigen/teichoic acid export membrane protein